MSCIFTSETASSRVPPCEIFANGEKKRMVLFTYQVLGISIQISYPKEKCVEKIHFLKQVSTFQIKERR